MSADTRIRVVVPPAPVAPITTRAPGGRAAWVVAAVVLLVCLPEPSFQVGAATFTPADVASLVLVGVTGAGLLGGRYTIPRPAAVAFGAIATGAVISTVMATDTGAALSGLVRYLQLFVLVPVAAMCAVRSRRDFAVVGGAFVLGGLVQGAVGVVQYLTGTGASIGGQTVRAVGTFGAQEILAMSGVVSFAMLVAAACALGAERTRPRVLFAAVTATLAVPLAFSLSRGSWLATALALAVVLACAGTRRFVRVVVLVVAAAIVLVGGFGVGAGQVGDRIGSVLSTVSAPDSSVGDRYHLWHTATSIWSEHPVTGAGIRSFPVLRDAHAPLALSSSSDTAQPGLGYVKQELLSPHNQYLLVLAEQGLLGAIALIGTLALCVVAVLIRLQRATGRWRTIGLAALGVGVWHGIQFVYADSGGPTSVLTAILIGLVASYGLAARSGDTLPAGPAPLAATATAALSPPAAAAPTRTRRSVESSMVLTATAISAALIGLGAIGGVARDLLLASYFGADGTTDAFLVAWTVAESAVPLLIDGAMALLLVPAFTRALAVAGTDDTFYPSTDPRSAVASVVAFVLPRLMIGMVVVSGVVMAAAPWLVQLLAPGLAVPDLGIQAMRIVAGSLLLIGLAGFAAGALRAHLVFGPPAAISLAFNVGIISSIVLLHERFGVLAAAIGVTVGAALALAVQLPSYLRRLPAPRQVVLRTTLVSTGVFIPIAVYTLTRQAQVFVERFFGSNLQPGTISHLNYAQKIGQLPSSLALIIAVVTFPLLARSLVAGEANDARRRMEADVRIVGAVVLLSTTFLFVFAPRVVQVLFERGEFGPADTAGTSAILRIYVLGLLGQALVELLCRALFSGRSTFLPAITMTVGLVVTAGVAGFGAMAWGAPGIALGNAAGITVTALGLLFARRSREAAVAPRVIGAIIARLVPAAITATLVGLLVSGAVASLPSASATALGGVVMLLTFVTVAMTSGGLPTLRQFLGKGAP